MTIVNKSKNGLSTRLFNYVLNKFFNTNAGKEVTDIYGLSFNPSIQFMEIPTLFPEKNTFHKVANDLSLFEVLNNDIDTDLITIRELGTEIEYSINVDLFNVLFIEEKKPDLNTVLTKIKE